MFRSMIGWFIACVVLSFPVIAGGGELTGELQVITYRSHGESLYTGKQLFLEKGFSGKSDMSVFAMVYHDESFKEAQLGLAKWLTNELQLGVGLGKARTGGSNISVISPWLYYENDDLRVDLLTEAYSAGKPFFKVNLEKDVSGSVYVGLYGETGVGLGPKVGYKVNDHISFWASRPVVDRGDVQLLFAVNLEF
jgi:hypothetical protein